MYFKPERNRRLAEKLFRHVRDTTTDQAEGLFEYDLSIYADPEVAALERERIFERLPMMALHASQLPEPGSFVTVRLNRTTALVTRGRDGVVRAFQNICRHRGTELVTAASGKRSRFTCPYHGWTYSTAGELVGVSFPESVGISLPCPARNLTALPTEERHGFIWIVENPEGDIDIAAYLGPEMDQALREYGFETHFLYREATFEFPQNWKIMMDGLNDGYHVQFVHGATIRPYFYMNMMGLDVAGGHVISATPRRTIDRILHEEPGTSPIDAYAVIGNMILPNSSMVLHPHHIEYWTMYQDPNEPGRCRAHLRYLTPQARYDADGQAILEKNWKIATAAIVNEDVPIGDSIQRSASAPRAGKAVLGLNEVVNQQFHRTYRRYMEA